MFLDTSRYAKLKAVQVTTKSGRTVAAVKLRRLPATPGDAAQLKGNDRLDTIAKNRYNDATRFWHIADANSELDSRTLAKPKGIEDLNPPIRVIQVPAQ